MHDLVKKSNLAFQTITEGAVAFRGKNYHRKCFLCAGGCGAELGGTEFGKGHFTLTIASEDHFKVSEGVCGSRLILPRVKKLMN